MFGLDEKVSGKSHDISRVVGNDKRLGWTEQHHRRDAVSLHLDLRDGDSG